MFLPSFLYRLNIKATAWFWWPLAYLLRPVRRVDAESEQRQQLCWPLTDPVGKGVIFFSIGLATAGMIVTWLASAGHFKASWLNDLPVPVRILLGLGWSRFGLWHGLLVMIGLTGGLMLMLAGHAHSQQRNNNWHQYAERARHLIWMTQLRRIRNLFTIALLALAFGALLLVDLQWRDYIPVPENWIAAMQTFYRTSSK